MINTINIFPTQYALHNFNQSSAINNLFKAKQSTKDMSCENKLTNLIFKNKENSAKTQFASFSFLFFFFFNIKKNLEWNAWMLCNANPRNKRKKSPKNQRTKNNGHKGKNNEAQRSSQKDSVRSSLLHLKPFRWTMSIGVCIHIRVISISRIGIKV